MAYQDPTFGLTVPGVRQAPPAVVRRDNLGFAPGLQIMQPARDAQNLRDLRDTEAMYEDQRAITSAINADTQNLCEFNQGTAAAEQRGQAYRDQVAADTAARTTPNAAPTYQPAQRGNYNMTNTDPSKLAKPVGAGLTFGFGGGNETASQYLARMNAQDRLAAQDHAQWQRTMEQDIARTRVMA